MWDFVAKLIGGPLVNGLLEGYKAKLSSVNSTEAHAVDLAKKEIEADIAARAEATKVIALENGHWWMWLPRWCVQASSSAFFCKCVVWDTMLGLGTTPALGGDVKNTYLLVMAMWFGSHMVSKVTSIFKR